MMLDRKSRDLATISEDPPCPSAVQKQLTPLH